MAIGGWGCTAADGDRDECSAAVEEQYAAQVRYLDVIPEGAGPDPEAAAELLATTDRTYPAAASCSAEQAAWLAAERSYALAEAAPERHLAEYDELMERAAVVPEYGELVQFRQARALRLGGRPDEALALYEERQGPVAIQADVGRALALEATGDYALAYWLWMDIHARAGQDLGSPLARRISTQARERLGALMEAAAQEEAGGAASDG